jgi:transcriptional regulator with XRE-family HTH domain
MKRSNNQRVRVLANKLREMRLASGLSQSKLAERLHKPQSYISRCEAGLRRIDIFELQEFARVYDKPLTFFVENLSTTFRGHE